MALLALLLSFAGEYLSGRLLTGNAFIYYLLPLAATIPILVYTVFTGSPVSFLPDKTAQLTLYLVLSTTLFLGTLRYASGFRFTTDKKNWFTGIPEVEYLDTYPWRITSYMFSTIPTSLFFIMNIKFLLLHPGYIIISGTGAMTGTRIAEFFILLFKICKYIKPVLYWIVLKQGMILKTKRLILSGSSFFRLIIQ